MVTGYRRFRGADGSPYGDKRVHGQEDKIDAR